MKDNVKNDTWSIKVEIQRHVFVEYFLYKQLPAETYFRNEWLKIN